MPLTTLAFFSAFVCLTQRSCVSGRTVEMALERESLLLLHVAPCSFSPGGRKSHIGVGTAPRTRRPRGSAQLPPSTPLKRLQVGALSEDWQGNLSGGAGRVQAGPWDRSGQWAWVCNPTHQ